MFRLQFGDDQVYKERITLWRATDMDAAIELAETEALEYAADLDGEYTGFAQANQLWDQTEPGAEVFSFMRSSRLDIEDYLDHFFDTGTGRQQGWPSIDCQLLVVY
ncbi:hypothetical protein [Allobranchiibius huperziae]|uniref:Uncharacterized protein n=1 Tax=Allobranchiibius huperziae TaxID=1874116 RepID=A0A853DNZ6_9MICO|nr:hypothetical protein [Allobranchiibius huperziae]NYJ76481.1 hypothetical protein [Allobranchiibius huperziae]